MKYYITPKGIELFDKMRQGGFKGTWLKWGFDDDEYEVLRFLRVSKISGLSRSGLERKFIKRNYDPYGFWSKKELIAKIPSALRNLVKQGLVLRR